MSWWRSIDEALARHGACAAVTVASVRGSAPREPGARLLVTPGGQHSGTIGGGALEWQALDNARRRLAHAGSGAHLSVHALGPDLGQCCGGSVRLLTECFDRSSIDNVCALAQAEVASVAGLGMFWTRTEIHADGARRVILNERPADLGAPDSHGRRPPGSGGGGSHARLSSDSVLYEAFGERRRALLLFGAGHVGRALMLALAPLPFQVTWIDNRANIFPPAVPSNVVPYSHQMPARMLSAAPDGAFVLVMTHSHPLDLEIVHAALAAQRFAYVGVIGSASKRARFKSRLRIAGLAPALIDRLVCPIGTGGIRSRLPAAIAVSVCAQLLAVDEALELGGCEWPSESRAPDEPCYDGSSADQHHEDAVAGAHMLRDVRP